MSAVYLTAHDCSPVQLSDVGHNFHNCDEVDAFLLSGGKMVGALSFSPDRQLTLVGENFTCRNLTTGELLHAESKVNINNYRSSSRDGVTGKPVILFVRQNGQHMVLSCCDEHQVKAVAKVPPKLILGKTDDSLFYLIIVEGASKKYMLESVKYKKRFLTYKDDSKLVLAEEDDMNEDCHFIFSE